MDLEKYRRWHALSATMTCQQIADQAGNTTRNMVVGGIHRYRKAKGIIPVLKTNLAPTTPPAPLPATRLERGKIFYDLNAKGTP